MAQETKVGLLIGLALILLVGLLLSDLISNGQETAGNTTATDFGREAQRGIYQPPATTPAVSPVGRATASPFQPEADPHQSPVQPAGLEPGDATSPSPHPELPEPAVREAATPPQLTQLPSAWRVSPSQDIASQPTTPPIQEVGEASAGVSVFSRDEPQTMGSTFIPPVIDRKPGAGQPPLVDPVHRGQTLTEIARNLDPDPGFVRRLAEANPDAFDAQGRLRPGATVRVPTAAAASLFEPTPAFHASHAAEVAPDEPAPLGPPTREAAAARRVEVRAGDTLSGLAAEHLGDGHRWAELLEANRGVLASPEQLRAGMTLRLPGTRPASSPNLQVTARRAASSEAEPVAPAARTYTVRAGDNLTRIAAKQLGDGDRWRQLLEANADQLQRPEQLQAGMVLKLPAAASAPAAEASPPSPATRTYTVRAGDNLTRIAAKQLGDSDRWRELFDVNSDRLNSPDALYAGQVLKLP